MTKNVCKRQKINYCWLKTKIALYRKKILIRKFDWRTISFSINLNARHVNGVTRFNLKMHGYLKLCNFVEKHLSMSVILHSIMALPTLVVIVQAKQDVRRLHYFSAKCRMSQFESIEHVVQLQLRKKNWLVVTREGHSNYIGYASWQLQ